MLVKPQMEPIIGRCGTVLEANLGCAILLPVAWPRPPIDEWPGASAKQC